MATKKQIEANRRNANKSTGPRTPEGKAVSSLNALTHGLTAERIVLPWEDQEEFEQLRVQVFEHYAPEGPMERELADTIATQMWRLRRARTSEAGVLSRCYVEGLHDDARSIVIYARERLNGIERAGEPLAEAPAPQGMTEDCDDESEGLLQSYRAARELEDMMDARLQAEPMQSGEAMLPEGGTGNFMDKLPKYEAYLERSLYRAMERLDRLKAVLSGGTKRLKEKVVVDMREK